MQTIHTYKTGHRLVVEGKNPWRNSVLIAACAALYEGRLAHERAQYVDQTIPSPQIERYVSTDSENPLVSRLCEKCGSSYLSHPSRRTRYCGDECRLVACKEAEKKWRENKKSAGLSPRRCIHCKVVFNPKQVGQKYCNAACAYECQLKIKNAKYVPLVFEPVACLFCSTIFTPKQVTNKFCRSECRINHKKSATRKANRAEFLSKVLK